MYLFLLGWSSYGTEAAATFAPEYKDTVGETRKAFLSSATFSLLVFTLLPLGLGGTTGAVADTAQTCGSTACAEAPSTCRRSTRSPAARASALFTICLIGSLLLSMSTSTGDAGRALFGISRSA